MSGVLCALDLDRTLIYSRHAAASYPHDGASLVPVERYQGADASFVTATAAAGLAALAADTVLVPTTTRTPAQYARVELPGGPFRWAVASNGGVLLENGSPDAGWSDRVAAALATVHPADEVHAHASAACDAAFTRSLRRVDDLFAYAVLERALVPDGFLDAERAWAAARGWQVSLQGRKLYWVPLPLTKSAAVAEVARRAGTDVLLAAGDSLLDADLLEAADAGIAGAARRAGRERLARAARHGDRRGGGRGGGGDRRVAGRYRCQSPSSRPSGTTSPGAYGRRVSTKLPRSRCVTAPSASRRTSRNSPS